MMGDESKSVTRRDLRVGFCCCGWDGDGTRGSQWHGLGLGAELRIEKMEGES